MAHAISVTSLRFEHMSPTAAGMAVTLHLATALALFLATPARNYEVPQQAIEITMEEPPPPTKPADPQPEAKPQPPPAPATAQSPPPAPPPPAAPPAAMPLGLPPIETKPMVTDRTTSPKPLGLPPPAERTTEPPQVATAPATPPKEEPKPEPAEPAESKLPAVEMPAAPLNMQDFVRAAPPPPPQEIVRPQPRVQPPPPPTAAHQHPPPPQLQPSPLHTQQPQHAPSNSQATASLVNPADARARARVQDEYLWGVGRKISEHRAFSASNTESGTVILRLTIGRDGRLAEAGIARSSGSPSLDAAVLASARQASPYMPLPAELTGQSVTFILPLGFRKYD